MGNDEHRAGWPLWVRVGLWKVPNRAAAWAYFWLAFVLAVGFVAYGLVDPRFFIGGILVISAVWYYGCIVWVDRNGRW